MEVGRPHEKEFSIRCTVLKFCEIGTGKSKKIAKRQAAQKLYERLQTLTLDQSEIVQSCIDENNDEVSFRCFNEHDGSDDDEWVHFIFLSFEILGGKKAY